MSGRMVKLTPDVPTRILLGHDNRYCDINFHIGATGIRFPAHSIIFHGVSRWVGQLLSRMRCHCPDQGVCLHEVPELNITLAGFDPGTVNSFLTLLYCGTVCVTNPYLTLAELRPIFNELRIRMNVSMIVICKICGEKFDEPTPGGHLLECAVFIEEVTNKNLVDPKVKRGLVIVQECHTQIKNYCQENARPDAVCPICGVKKSVGKVMHVAVHFASLVLAILPPYAGKQCTLCKASLPSGLELVDHLIRQHELLEQFWSSLQR